ncbi:guanine nucleotide exchange factor 9 [Phlyctochytrium bullatum]|nr:guanine nucleotide exchange factor 9 [Phlyctochytrium bullatum]
MAGLLQKIRSALNLPTAPSDPKPAPQPRTSVDRSLKPRFTKILAASLSRRSLDSRDSVATVRVDEDRSRVSVGPQIPPLESAVASSPADSFERVTSDDPSVKRRIIIKELLESDATYLRDFKRALELYLRGLARAKIVSERDFRTLFSNMEVLLEGHEQLQELNSGNDDLSDEDVSRIIAQLSNLLTAYSVYIQTLPKSQTRLHALSKNEGFRGFLYTRLVCDHRRLGLDGFLLEPYQRLRTYPAWLRELLKYTEEGHKDFGVLRVAVERAERAVEGEKKPSIWKRVKAAISMPKRRR